MALEITFTQEHGFAQMATREKGSVARPTNVNSTQALCCRLPERLSTSRSALSQSSWSDPGV